MDIAGFINTRSFFLSVCSDLPGPPHYSICLLPQVPHCRGSLGNPLPRSTRTWRWLSLQHRRIPLSIGRSSSGAGSGPAPGACVAPGAEPRHKTPGSCCHQHPTLLPAWSHSDADTLQPPPTKPQRPQGSAKGGRFPLCILHGHFKPPEDRGSQRRNPNASPRQPPPGFCHLTVPFN